MFYVYLNSLSRAEKTSVDTVEKIQFLLDTLHVTGEAAQAKKKHREISFALLFSDVVKSLKQSGLVRDPIVKPVK